jgi:hypothetical protein
MNYLYLSDHICMGYHISTIDAGGTHSIMLQPAFCKVHKVKVNCHSSDIRFSIEHINSASFQIAKQISLKH